MAYEMSQQAYMCRTMRSTKLYARPTDIVPSELYLPPRCIFTTDKQFSNGTVTLLRVEQVSFGSDFKDVNTVNGMWVSTESLEMNPIVDQDTNIEQETESDDSVAISDYVLIHGTDIMLYDTAESRNPSIGVLTINSSITVDRKINLNDNGELIIKFRISECEENPEYVGKWILNNTSAVLKSVYDAVKPIMKTPEPKPIAEQRSVTAAAPKKAVTLAATPPSNVVNGLDGSTVMSKAKYTVINTVYGVGQMIYVNGIKNRAEAGMDIATGYYWIDEATNKISWLSTDRLTASGLADIKFIQPNTVAAGQVDLQREVYSDTNAAYNAQYSNTWISGFESQYSATTESTMGVEIGRMNFVHGMPFQYNYLTDRRVGCQTQWARPSVYDTEYKVSNGNNSDFYGRTFSKEIISNIPIMCVVPGIPKYMTNVKTGGTDNISKDTIRSLIMDDSKANEFISSLQADAKGKNTYQYYSMVIDTTSYFKYVNTLCRSSAIMLGIGTTKFRGQNLRDFDWGTYNSTAGQDFSSFNDIIGSEQAGGVAFAFDPQSSVTDSLGNSTGQSSMAQFFNEISEKARELSFILGTSTNSVNLGDITDNAYDKLFDLGNGGNGVLGRTAEFLKDSAHGYNVRFPEIWNDSSNQKSYSIDMKFIAPYATNFCKWRYVLVPFFHLFALAAPHQDESLVNYTRPFLVRVFSKGFFNVEMGIIESLQWRRFGDGDMISADGVPTEIDCTIDFKDLYQALGMTAVEPGTKLANFGLANMSLFFNNTGLMDLIGTMSGVNMNHMDLGERASMWAQMYGSNVKTIGNNINRKITDRISRMYERIFL